MSLPPVNHRPAARTTTLPWLRCDADIFIASPIRAALSALKRSLVLAAVIADIAVLPGHF
jgi:hypothetical protein